MDVRGFLLLSSVPQPDRGMHAVELGELSDGVFVVDDFPATADFGAIVELAVEPDEGGEFEVELLLSSIRLGGRNAYSREDFDLVAVKTFHFPPASDVWTEARTVWIPMRIELELPREVDVKLWIAVDKTLYGSRPLLFRIPPNIPPAM